MPIEPALLTIAEACEYLGLGRSHVYALLQPDGPIPAVQIGASVRIRRTDLDAWIDTLPARTPTPRGIQRAAARPAV